jgi:hypothetical protein
MPGLPANDWGSGGLAVQELELIFEDVAVTRRRRQPRAANCRGRDEEKARRLTKRSAELLWCKRKVPIVTIPYHFAEIKEIGYGLVLVRDQSVWE